MDKRISLNMEYEVDPSKYNPLAAMGLHPMGVTVCVFDVNPPMEVKVQEAIIGSAGASQVGMPRLSNPVGQ
jgi:hypothetical protein